MIISTYVDLVEDCKKINFCIFFISQESQTKQNGYNNMYSSKFNCASYNTNNSRPRGPETHAII